jgi:hypothetical protein
MSDSRRRTDWRPAGKLSDVDLQDPPAPHLHQPMPEGIQRLVRRAARPEAVRAVQEVLLIDGLQGHDDRTLEDLVLERGDADGPGLRSGPLRDVHPPHGRRLVAAGLGPVQQRSEVALQVRCVARRRLSVHPRSPVLTRALVRREHPVDVDVVGGRRQCHLRRSPRQLCYPLLSR